MFIQENMSDYFFPLSSFVSHMQICSMHHTFHTNTTRYVTILHQHYYCCESKGSPHQRVDWLICLLLLLRSLGYAVPRERPCRITTSSIWHWSMLTSTVVLLSVFMRKTMVKMAISNSGLVPMKALPTGFSKPCQLNCRLRTWSSWSGCGLNIQLWVRFVSAYEGTVYIQPLVQHRENYLLVLNQQRFTSLLNRLFRRLSSDLMAFTAELSW